MLLLLLVLLPLLLPLLLMLDCSCCSCCCCIVVFHAPLSQQIKTSQDTDRLFNPSCDVEFALTIGASESSLVPIAAGTCQTLDYCRDTCGFADAVQHGSFGDCCVDCVSYDSDSIRITVSGDTCSNNCPGVPESRPTPSPTPRPTPSPPTPSPPTPSPPTPSPDTRTWPKSGSDGDANTCLTCDCARQQCTTRCTNADQASFECTSDAGSIKHKCTCVSADGTVVSAANKHKWLSLSPVFLEGYRLLYQF